VFLPRLSNLVQNRKEAQFDALVEKSIALVIFVCLPASLGLAILSREIVQVMAGPKFLPAAPCVMVTAPIILLIGLTGVTGTQVLYPRGKERFVLIAAAMAAIISIGLNWLLIPSMREMGASIACLSAETLDFGMEAFFLWKFCPIRFPSRSAINYVLSGAAMTCVLAGTKLLVASPGMRIAVFPPLGAAVYLGTAMLTHDAFVGMSVSTLLGKVGFRSSASDSGDDNVG